MKDYTPYSWVVLKIDDHYKVFASWKGGYTTGDSWKMNSGIKEVNEAEKWYDFIGYSGSCYRCRKGRYGMVSYTHGVLDNIIKKGKEKGHTIEILPEDTDFKNLI